MASKRYGSGVNGIGSHAGSAAERMVVIRERLSPVMGRAAQRAREQALLARAQSVLAAGQAREWAAPRIGAVVDWAGPRLERGMERGLRAAAPRVEAAAERAMPAVDAVRDRILDDVLPRLVEAVNSAALAGAAAGAAAGEALGEATEIGARKAKAGLRAAATRAGQAGGGGKRRRRAMRRVAVATLAAAGAAAVAGVAAWRRAQVEEPLADRLDGEPSTGTSLTDGATGVATAGTGSVPVPEPVSDIGVAQGSTPTDDLSPQEDLRPTEDWDATVEGPRPTYPTMTGHQDAEEVGEQSSGNRPRPTE